jgi:hypothetical protein
VQLHFAPEGRRDFDPFRVPSRSRRQGRWCFGRVVSNITIAVFIAGSFLVLDMLVSLVLHVYRNCFHVAMNQGSGHIQKSVSVSEAFLEPTMGSIRGESTFLSLGPSPLGLAVLHYCFQTCLSCETDSTAPRDLTSVPSHCRLENAVSVETVEKCHPKYASGYTVVYSRL